MIQNERREKSSKIEFRNEAKQGIEAEKCTDIFIESLCWQLSQTCRGNSLTNIIYQMMINILKIMNWYYKQMTAYILFLSIFTLVQTQPNQCGLSCAICSATTPYLCSQCSPAFFIQSDYTCESCIQGCSNCQSKSTCNSCLPQYALFQHICVKCSSFCYSCSIIINKKQAITLEELAQYTTCDECWPGFYEVQNEVEAIRCQACPPACISCEKATECIECAVGFGFNSSSNQCYSCGLACNECNDQEGCTRCANGYRQQKESVIVCVPCQNNCISCTNETCNACSLEYYLVEGKCEKCQEPCLQCSGKNVCLRCQTGYYLNQDKTCEMCEEGCQLCSSSNQCSRCYSNYFLNSQNYCIECSPSCLHCLSDNNCLSCAASFYLKQGNCIQCLHPCATCFYSPANDSTIPQYACSTCVSDEYIIINAHCVLCTSVQQYIGCLTCSEQLGCLTCIEGYEYIGGKCQEQGPMRVVYIVLISIAAMIGLAAAGFGIWACWKSRSGYGAAGESDAAGVRSSYYEFP